MDLHFDIHTHTHTNRMTTQTATYWAYTLNNPDDNETQLVHCLYERCTHAIKTNVFQHETGESGTPHFQGLLQLQKQQRMSFVKKLLPRAHWTPMTKAEHTQNMKSYVQKRDETSVGTTTHQQSNPPLLDALALLRKMCRESIEADGTILSHEEWLMKDYGDGTTWKDYEKYCLDAYEHDNGHWIHFTRHLKQDELSLVEDDPNNAKIFITPAYKALKKDYLEQIYKHERLKLYTPENADEHESIQQDADGSVGGEHDYQEATIEVSSGQSEEDTDGEDDSDGFEDTEDGDTESDQGSGGD